MNEQLDSQLSAMFDDELPAAECELLARRLSKDEQLKARWASYSLIGATLRADRSARLSSEVARRVAKVLSAEAPLAAVPAIPAPRRRVAAWWQPVAGVAVAAGVAASAILFLRAHSPAEVSRTALVDDTTALRHGSPMHAEGAPGYVTPRSPPARRLVVPGTSLANYLVAHSEVSSPVASQAMLSVLLAGGEAGTAAPPSGSEELVPVEDQDQDDAK
jgi:sigma-E factor negative regulatory protein RseA